MASNFTSTIASPLFSLQRKNNNKNPGDLESSIATFDG